MSDAFEAVRQLRPQLLRQRGVATLRGAGRQSRPSGAPEQTGEIVVYVDRIRVGGLEALRNISVGTVHEIRYVNARDATTLYGTGQVGGVIEVRLKY